MQRSGLGPGIVQLVSSAERLSVAFETFPDYRLPTHPARLVLGLSVEPRSVQGKTELDLVNLEITR